MTTAIERAEVRAQGRPATASMALRVTMSSAGWTDGWKLVLRHADRLVAEDGAGRGAAVRPAASARAGV